VQKCTKSSRFFVVDKFVLDIQFFKQGKKIRNQTYQNTPSLMSLSRAEFRLSKFNSLKVTHPWVGGGEVKYLLYFRVPVKSFLYTCSMYSTTSVQGRTLVWLPIIRVLSSAENFINPLRLVRNCSNIYITEIRKERNSITHLISVISTVFIKLLHSRTVRNTEWFLLIAFMIIKKHPQRNCNKAR